MELLQFEKFDPYGDSKRLGQKWLAWKQNFQHYLVAKDIRGDDRCLSTLLVLAGSDVQKIYSQKKAEIDEQEHEEAESQYLEAMELLDEIFMKKTNESFQRALFRQIAQELGETIAAYVSRLREQAEFCSFNDELTLQNAIKDQIMDKGTSDKLRQAMWKKDRDLTEMIALATSMENVETYEKSFSLKRPLAEVNEVEQSRNDKRGKFSGSCWSCNQKGHRQYDPNCPAKGKQCLKCKKHGHFSSCCRAGLKKRNTQNFKTNKVRAIESENDEDDTEHVFNLDDEQSEEKCRVGGVDISVVIDSGTKRNLIPIQVWEQMKTKKVKTLEELKGSDVTFKAYGQDDPIPVRGRFKAQVVMNDIRSEAWFYVVEKGNACLLGKETALIHKVLKTGTVRAIGSSEFPKIRGNEFMDDCDW